MDNHLLSDYFFIMLWRNLLKRLKTAIFMLLSLLSASLNNILFFLCKSLNFFQYAVDKS